MSTLKYEFGYLYFLCCTSVSQVFFKELRPCLLYELSGEEMVQMGQTVRSTII